MSAKLNEEFAGSRIVGLETRLKKAKAWLEAHLGVVEGREVIRIQAAGKNMIWNLDGDLYFHFHLLMFGKVRTYSLRHRLSPDSTVRAHIVTTTRQLLLINGQIFNIGIGDPFEQVPVLQELGPDICAVPFQREFFLQRLNRPTNLDKEIAPVLLEQSVAAGVGNYLKSDILFECAINPWTLVGALTPEQQQRLADVVPSIAERTLRNKGQTVSDEVWERISNDTERTSRWWDRHWVFRQTNRPCKVCGTPIKQKRQGPGDGRMTFFCPLCQNVDLLSISTRSTPEVEDVA